MQPCLPRHQRIATRQSGLHLQTFRCSNAGVDCTEVLRQLPAKHLTTLELQFDDATYMPSDTWEQLADTIAGFTRLRSLTAISSCYRFGTSSLTTAVAFNLTALTSLTLREVQYHRLYMLPNSLVELSVGSHRVAQPANNCKCSDSDSDEGTAGTPGGVTVRSAHTVSAISAFLALDLTQLTCLTRLHSGQLCHHDQLPDILQDVSVDSCHSTKPLLGLMRLTGLSLGSTISITHVDVVEDDPVEQQLWYNGVYVGAAPVSLEPDYMPLPIEGLAQLTALTGLVELRLKYNRVETANQDAPIWQTLSALKSLHLAHKVTRRNAWNMLIRLTEACQGLEQLTSLTSLRIEAYVCARPCELGTVIGQLTSLRFLAVNHTWERGYDHGAYNYQHLFGQLTGLQQLRRLECDMPITPVTANALARLSMLTGLDLELPYYRSPTPPYGSGGSTSDEEFDWATDVKRTEVVGTIVQALTDLKDLVIDGHCGTAS